MKPITALRTGVLALLITTTTCAQQNAPSGSPLDIPDIVVRGSATLRLMNSSFLKQQPAGPRMLTSGELDSLNPKQQHDVIRLSQTPPPSVITRPKDFNGMIQASIGRYQTPEVDASLTGSLFDHAFFADLSFLSTEGYMAATSMTSFQASMRMRQAFKENDGPLASSFHDSRMVFTSRRYSEFARPDSATLRSAQGFALNSAIDLTTSIASIRTEVRLGSFSLEQSLQSRESNSEQRLSVYAEIKPVNLDSAHALVVSVDFRPFRSVLTSDHFLQYRYSGFVGSTNINGGIGLRAATGDRNASRVGVTAFAQASHMLSTDMHVGVSFCRDMRTMFFSDAVGAIPYLRPDAGVDIERINASASLFFRYQPSRFTDVDLRTSYGSYAAMAIPVFDSGSAFRFRYDAVNTLVLSLRGAYRPNDMQEWFVELRGRRAVMDKDGTVAPYQAPVELISRFTQQWQSGWRVSLGVSYVGSRTTGSSGSADLGGYVFADAKVDYAVSGTLSLFLRSENLTNSSIFVFERYRERDVYGAFGLQWKF